MNQEWRKRKVVTATETCENVNVLVLSPNTCLFFLCWERAALQSVSSEIMLEDIPGWIFFAPGARSSSSAATCEKDNPDKQSNNKKKRNNSH